MPVWLEKYYEHIVRDNESRIVFHNSAWGDILLYGAICTSLMFMFANGDLLASPYPGLGLDTGEDALARSRAKV